MPPILQRPDGAGAVDLDDHRLEAGLVRLAVLGADGFELRFDDPAVVTAAASCLAGPEAPGPFDAEALRPLIARGLAALTEAAPGDDGLRRLLTQWRPRALRLLDRGEEVSGEEKLRLRLEDRLEELGAAVEAARAAGDDDRAQALHARYIELGTTYAGRLAQLW